MSSHQNDPIQEAVEIVEQNRAAQIEGQRQGEVSLFTCPECGGTLWHVNEPELLQFRCHVGHILNGEGLLKAQKEAAENSLWYCIRTLNDHMVLARELARYARKEQDEQAARDFDKIANTAEQRAQTLRAMAESD